MATPWIPIPSSSARFVDEHGEADEDEEEESKWQAEQKS